MSKTRDRSVRTTRRALTRDGSRAVLAAPAKDPIAPDLRAIYNRRRNRTSGS